MRATLEHVLTESAFERMIALANAWADGVASAIAGTGCRGRCSGSGAGPSTGSADATAHRGRAAAAADDHELARFTHLYALNRGILLTPFHNMALMSPATTEADVDAHTTVFDEMATELTV